VILLLIIAPALVTVTTRPITSWQLILPSLMLCLLLDNHPQWALDVSRFLSANVEFPILAIATIVIALLGLFGREPIEALGKITAGHSLLAWSMGTWSMEPPASLMLHPLLAAFTAAGIFIAVGSGHRFALMIATCFSVNWPGLGMGTTILTFVEKLQSLESANSTLLGNQTIWLPGIALFLLTLGILKCVFLGWSESRRSLPMDAFLLLGVAGLLGGIVFAQLAGWIPTDVWVISKSAAFKKSPRVNGLDFITLAFAPALAMLATFVFFAGVIPKKWTLVLPSPGLGFRFLATRLREFESQVSRQCSKLASKTFPPLVGRRPATFATFVVLVSLLCLIAWRWKEFPH